MSENVEAAVVNSLSRTRIQFGLLGLAVGTTIGATAAYFYAYHRAEKKYTKIADDEIASMREHYRNKTVALGAHKGKDNLESIVSEKGYSEPDPVYSEKPPMVVKPPTPEPDRRRKSESDEEDEPDEEEMGADASTPDIEKFGPDHVRNVFEDAHYVDQWDEYEERRHRSVEHPYVIHKDEKDAMGDEYEDYTLTYFTGDDVLCYHNDDIIAPEDRDRVIGEANLDKFGHGSGDPAIVYVRNDKLEMVFEICRSSQWYAESIAGFSHTDLYPRNLERMRARERDEPEE